MGKGTRPGGLGHTIKTWWPDDLGTIMYIASGSGTTMSDLLEQIQRKWPGVSLDDIEINTAHIQTDCIGCVLYDPGNYTDFIVISRTDI